MSNGSEDLFESLTRLARSVGKAVQREAPYVRRAAGRIVKNDLPAFEKAAERTVGKFVQDLRRRGR